MIGILIARRRRRKKSNHNKFSWNKFPLSLSFHFGLGSNSRPTEFGYFILFHPPGLGTCRLIGFPPMMTLRHTTLLKLILTHTTLLKLTLIHMQKNSSVMTVRPTWHIGNLLRTKLKQNFLDLEKESQVDHRLVIKSTIFWIYNNVSGKNNTFWMSEKEIIFSFILKMIV